MCYVSCPLGQGSLLNLDSWGMEDRGLIESHVTVNTTASATTQKTLRTSVLVYGIFCYVGLLSVE